MNPNAKILCEIWNTLLLNNKIEVCTDSLKGIGITEIKLLKLCYLHPEYKIKDYLVSLSIPNSTLTNMVNRLVKKQLIERTIDTTDLRSFGLKLTQHGQYSITDHFSKEQDLFESLLSGMTDSEQNQFLQLFSKLTESLCQR